MKRLLIFFFALFYLSPPAYAELISRDGPLLTVRETGQAQLGEGSKTQVKEKAKLSAIRKAIELYAGVHISSSSRMKNFELQEDVVQSYNRAYIKSVRELGYRYDRATETGVYKGEFVIDTSVMAKMAEAQQALAASRNKPVEAAVFLFDGDGRMINGGRTVQKGDRFNLMVQPTSDLYGYMISRDSQGNLFNIFPNRDVSRHANPLRGGVQYFFPPKDSDLIFAFDNNPGRDWFYFLFSAAPLPDMDALFSQLAHLEGEKKQALFPIIQERIASRGIALQSKSTRATIAGSGSQENKTERRVGELLRGTGAFVKTLLLHHVK